MKQGWEYKKLGEVFQTSSGGTPSKSHNEYYEGGEIPWLRSGEVSQGDIYATELFITQEGMNNSSAKLFPCNTVVIAMYGATVGQIGILRNEMCTNQAVCGIFPNDSYKPEFLKLVLTAQKREYLKLAVGGAQPNISQQIIKDTLIPNIPLPTQQAIVSELDTLSSIIAECKETLKDYDALEQSIFYDMFGDPVKNEKGWEVKKLGEICTFKNGVNFSKNDKGTQYKFIGVSDFQDKKEIQARELDSILIEEKISEEYYLKDGDIVFVRSNGSKSLVGRNVLVHIQDEVVIFSGFCIRARLHDKQMTPLFLLHILKSDGIKSQISNSGRGCNISNLNQKILDSINIIAPPLPLQQSFATKIEAIEQMKAETKEALQEAETLFQARMDYWFG